MLAVLPGIGAILTLLLGIGGTTAARKLLLSGVGKAGKAAVGGLLRKAVPAGIAKRVGAGVAKLPGSVRRAGGFLGGAGKEAAFIAGVDVPIFFGAQKLLEGREPTSIHGESSLVPPQGGADELTRLLASLSGGMEGGELDALDLEELLSKFSPPAQERRLV